jgi:hypothetical protein
VEVAGLFYGCRGLGLTQTEKKLITRDRMAMLRFRDPETFRENASSRCKNNSAAERKSQQNSEPGFCSNRHCWNTESQYFWALPPAGIPIVPDAISLNA